MECFQPKQDDFLQRSFIGIFFFKDFHDGVSSYTDSGRLVLKECPGGIGLEEPAFPVTDPCNKEGSPVRPGTAKLGIGLHVVAEFLCQGFDIDLLIVSDTIDLALYPCAVNKRPGVTDQTG
jgi:hypothetical protein